MPARSQKSRRGAAGLYALLVLSAGTLAFGFVLVHHGMWEARNRARIAADAAALAAAAALVEHPRRESVAHDEAQKYAAANGCGRLDCRTTVERDRDGHCRSFRVRVELHREKGKDCLLAAANAVAEQGVHGFRRTEDAPAPLGALALSAEDPNVILAWRENRPVTAVVGNNAMFWTTVPAPERAHHDEASVGGELAVGSPLALHRENPADGDSTVHEALEVRRRVKAYPIVSTASGAATVVGFLPATATEDSSESAAVRLTPAPMTVAARLTVRDATETEHEKESRCPNVWAIKLTP